MNKLLYIYDSNLLFIIHIFKLEHIITSFGSIIQTALEGMHYSEHVHIARYSIFHVNKHII
jgi:hypothetical protein